MAKLKIIFTFLLLILFTLILVWDLPLTAQEKRDKEQMGDDEDEFMLTKPASILLV